MGGWGGNCPPQFNKTRKFSVEVGNLGVGIEAAMEKRVALKKERVSILNEQTKCSRSICSMFLSHCALTFLSKTRRKWLGIGWVKYRYFREVLERGGLGGGVLSQCKGWSFQNFPSDAQYETNDLRIVKVSMSLLGAGNNWMVRSVLRQSRGSFTENLLEKYLLILIKYSSLSLADMGSRRSY